MSFVRWFLFPTFLLETLLFSGCTHRSSPSSQSSNEGAPAASVPSAGSAALSSASSPAAPTAPGPWNVLLISIDSLRADMPWAGYERPIAPRLTELEKRAVSYTRAYALSSYTSMSVGGFLSGEIPGTVKRDGFFFGTYPADVRFFPERLAAAGVQTAGAQAHGYFRKCGFEQGFNQWRLVPGLKWNAQTDENITAPEHEQIAEEILSDQKFTAGRFFAWFHFLDPHDQYRAHPDGTKWGTKPRDLYDGEVEFTDRYVGKLLDFVAAQPWAARTAIIVTADHGEAFGEHGLTRHGFEIYEPLVRVPWFFVIPGVAPKHIDVARSHLDLAPTVLALLNVEANPPLPGQNLLPEITGSMSSEARPVIVDLPRTSDNDRRRAVVLGRHKIIAYGDDAYYQVYDVLEDPAEKNDWVKTDKEKARPLIQAYKEAVAGLRDINPYACRKLKGAPEGRDH